MAYNVPSLQITQEFTANTVFTDSPLATLIIGPHMSDGAITAIAIGTAGSGYGTTPPTITITDPTGTGATATATLTAGAVSAITITAGGTGYSASPTVTFSAPTTGVRTVAGAVTVTRVIDDTNSGSIGSVETIADIEALFGDVATNNPIAYGLKMAVQNGGGTRVYYCAVATDDTDGYTAALDLAEKSELYYGIVPMSQDPDVQDLVISHVDLMSSPTKLKVRACWLSSEISDTGTAQEQVDGYLAALPAVSSTNANSGPRRVRNVFPSTYQDANLVTLPGYYLAAGLAAMRAGSVPHQSLTNTEIVGPYYLPLTVNTYTETQLDTMAEAGVWIVTQEAKGLTAYTRHQLTGDGSSLNFREESVTSNVDSITRALRAALAPFVGIYNIGPASLLKVRTAVDKELSYRLTNTYTERAGNQLLGYKIISVAQNATFLDRIDVVVQLQVPYPMNYITVSLSI